MLKVISAKIKPDTSLPVQEIEVNGVFLHGILSEPEESNKTACLLVHGTAGNFYDDYWVWPLSKMAAKKGYAFLTANNRGNAVLHAYPPHGAAMEKFSDCVADIDGWLSFLKQCGYTKFVLIGHSLGTEKIVHYMSKKINESVIGIVLLGFSDSFGEEESHSKGRLPSLLKEARKLKNSSRGHEFLTSEWLSHAGTLPKSAESFLDFFSAGSDLSKALPFRTGKLESYSKIDIPILGVIGDQEEHEYTVVSIKKAISLLVSNNSNATVEQINDCDHDFTNKEDKLTKIVGSFLDSSLATS